MVKKLIFGFLTLLLGVVTFSQLALLRANAETPLSYPITYFETTPTPTITSEPESNTNTVDVTVNNTNSSEQKSLPSDEPTPYVCTDINPGSAPTLVSATQTGNNSITLFWNKGQDPVTHYAIVYGTRSSESQFGIINTGSNATSYTINSLIAGQTYYFRVYAINGCKPGDYSNELSATALGQRNADNNDKDAVLGDYDSQEQTSSDEEIIDYPDVDLSEEDDSWAWLFQNRIFESIGSFFSNIFGFFTGK